MRVAGSDEVSRGCWERISCSGEPASAGSAGDTSPALISILFNYVRVCARMHVCVDCGDQRRRVFLELELQAAVSCLTGALGI